MNLDVKMKEIDGTDDEWEFKINFRGKVKELLQNLNKYFQEKKEVVES